MNGNLFLSLTSRLAWIRRAAYAVLGAMDRLLFSPQLVTVYCYHSISRDPWKFSIEIGEFKKQVEHLVSRYQPITMSQLSEYLDGKTELSKPSFALTFDDGTRDVLEVVDFLKERGVCPTIFLLGDTNRAHRKELGTDMPLLTDDEARTLVQSGWEIGSHSMTHTAFGSMTPEQMNVEIAESKRALENRLGVPVNYFSFPKGVYTSRALEVVRASGYKLAVTMDDGMLGRWTDKFRIPRVGVDKSHKMFEFKVLASRPSVMFRRLIKQIA